MKAFQQILFLGLSISAFSLNEIQASANPGANPSNPPASGASPIQAPAPSAAPSQQASIGLNPGLQVDASEKEAKEREVKVQTQQQVAAQNPRPQGRDVLGNADMIRNIGSYLQHSHNNSNKNELDEIRDHVQKHGSHPDMWKLTGRVPPEKLHVSSETQELESFAMASKRNYKAITGKEFDKKSYQEELAVRDYINNPLRQQMYAPYYQLSDGPDSPNDRFRFEWGRILSANRSNVPVELSVDARRFGENTKINKRFDVLVGELRKNQQGTLSLSNITTANNQLRDILGILTNQGTRGQLDGLNLSCDFQSAPDFELLRKSAKWLTLKQEAQQQMNHGHNAWTMMPLPTIQAFHQEIVERGTLQNLMGFNSGVSYRISDWIADQLKNSERDEKGEKDSKSSQGSSGSQNLQNVQEMLRLMSEIELQSLEQGRRWERVHAYTHAVRNGKDLKTLGPKPEFRPVRIRPDQEIVILYNPTEEDIAKLISKKPATLKMLKIVYTNYLHRENTFWVFADGHVEQALNAGDEHPDVRGYRYIMNPEWVQRSQTIQALSQSILGGNFPALLQFDVYNQDISDSNYGPLNRQAQEFLRKQRGELPIVDEADEKNEKDYKSPLSSSAASSAATLPPPSVSSAAAPAAAASTAYAQQPTNQVAPAPAAPDAGQQAQAGSSMDEVD